MSEWDFSSVRHTYTRPALANWATAICSLSNDVSADN